MLDVCSCLPRFALLRCVSGDGRLARVLIFEFFSIQFNAIKFSATGLTSLYFSLLSKHFIDWAAHNFLKRQKTKSADQTGKSY
jgi:hypothetical protein